MVKNSPKATRNHPNARRITGPCTWCSRARPTHLTLRLTPARSLPRGCSRSLGAGWSGVTCRQFFGRQDVAAVLRLRAAAGLLPGRHRRRPLLTGHEPARFMQAGTPYRLDNMRTVTPLAVRHIENSFFRTVRGVPPFRQGVRPACRDRRPDRCRRHPGRPGRHHHQRRAAPHCPAGAGVRSAVTESELLTFTGPDPGSTSPR
jgi:hypothetical protein